MGPIFLVFSVLILILSLVRGGPPLHPAVVESPLLTALCLGAGLLLFIGPRGDRLRRGLGRLLFDSPRPRFDLFLFWCTAVPAAVVSLRVFDGIPYLDDGVASLFQAGIFSRGSLTLPLPPGAPFFELFGVLGAEAGLGHWAGMYPPGWPALLLPGVAVGLPWLVNPLLGGALPLAAAALGREMYGERTGRIAGLLTMTSPALLILAGTHLSHTAAALFCALCLWSVLRLLRTGAGLYGLLAGVAWGAAFLCRPLDALLLGILFAAFPLVLWRQSLKAWRGVTLALAAALCSAALMAAFQSNITGDPLTPGHKIGMGKLGSFGFIQLWNTRAHTPSRAVDFSLKRLRAVNDRLSGWPLPFFLLALVPFWTGERRRRNLLLLAGPLILTFTFAFYWYYEGFFPGRYLSSSFPMLLVLAGRGLDLLALRAGGFTGPACRLLSAGVAASVLFAFFAAFPWEFRALHRNIGDVERTLPRVVDAYGISNAVVFMDSVTAGVEEQAKFNDFFGTGFLRNSLDLDGDVVYARNSREQNHLLISLYPGRSYYLYRYHRNSRRALLYRILPSGKEFCLLPLEPKEPDLLILDTSRAGGSGDCGERE
jgi:hypothetical protein